jgi:very-short-patch-repair endonuclease
MRRELGLNWSDWHRHNLELMRRSSPHGWEERFSREILQLVKGLNFTNVSVQVPFGDPRGKRRFMDFAIVEPPGVRLAIEVDDRATHDPSLIRSEKFTDDVARQNELVLEGYTLLRFTVAQIRDTPTDCVGHVQAMLDRLRRSAAPTRITATTPRGRSAGLARVVLRDHRLAHGAGRRRLSSSCESCGDPVSVDVVEYCRDYAWLFRGKVFCVLCQDELYPYR